MFFDSNFKPKSIHFFYVKELLIEVRRKKWREEELERRRILFSKIEIITPLYSKIYNFFKKSKIFID